MTASRGTSGRAYAGLMIKLLRKRFESSNRLYTDLAMSIGPSELDSRLPGIASNTIGGQFWCVAGGRHSSAQAVRAGEWQGFMSAMTAAEAIDPESVVRILGSTNEAVVGLFDASEEFTEAQLRILLALLEHEAYHHGQLTRYLYGLEIDRPDSWKRRYSLT